MLTDHISRMCPFSIDIHEPTKTIQVNTKEMTLKWARVEIEGKT